MQGPVTGRFESLSKNTKLWRYISLPKLVSMLSTKELYFRRVDKLDDRRESMLSPHALTEKMAAYVKQARDEGILKEHIDSELVALLTAGSADMLIRASVFVNCWHESDAESTAMWNVYSGQGIAIQTTLRRLMEALPDTVQYGPIEYIEYGSESRKMNPELPFLFKDRIFQFENEFRAFVTQQPRKFTIISVNHDHPSGIAVPVNLHRLIKKVYVSPSSGSWFRDVVAEVLAKYGLGTKDVLASIADHVPEYRRFYEDERRKVFEQSDPFPTYPSEEETAGTNGTAAERD